MGRRFRLVSLLVLVVVVAAACGSDDDEEADPEGDGSIGTATTEADEDVDVDVPEGVTIADPGGEGNCLDAISGEPAPCEPQGIDIVNVRFEPGSVAMIVTVTEPGLASLPDQWRLDAQFDTDADAATGVEVPEPGGVNSIGGELEVQVRPQGDVLGVSVAHFDAEGSALASDTGDTGDTGGAEGSSAEWTTDTTLEVVLSDAALDVPGEGGGTVPTDFDAQPFYVCLEAAGAQSCLTHFPGS